MSNVQALDDAFRRDREHTRQLDEHLRQSEAAFRGAVSQDVADDNFQTITDSIVRIADR